MGVLLVRGLDGTVPSGSRPGQVRSRVRGFSASSRLTRSRLPSPAAMLRACATYRSSAARANPGRSGPSVVGRPPTSRLRSSTSSSPCTTRRSRCPRECGRLHEYLARGFPFSWRDHHRRQRDRPTAHGSSPGSSPASSPASARVHLDAKGRGRALRSAWTASDAAVVAYMDVDLSTDLDALLPLRGAARLRALRPRHRIAARAGRVGRAASEARVHLALVQPHPARRVRHPRARRAVRVQGGPRRRRAAAAARPIRDDGWFFDTELLLLAEHNGLRIHEVPVDWVDDADSRVDVVTDGASTTWRGSSAWPDSSGRDGGRVDLGDAARPAARGRLRPAPRHLQCDRRASAPACRSCCSCSCTNRWVPSVPTPSR